MNGRQSGRPPAQLSLISHKLFANFDQTDDGRRREIVIRGENNLVSLLDLTDDFQISAVREIKTRFTAVCKVCNNPS